MKGALGLTQDEMSAALEKNYAVQAKRLGTRIVPVGAALQLYRKGLPVRLMKPTKAELAALKDGEVPDLMQTCVWTAALFGVDLAELGYAPDLGVDFARRAPFIRACAMKAVNAQRTMIPN